jgi:DNA-binding transcriptional MerR regulator
MTDPLTLPQIARRVGASYRTLQTWVERGLVVPGARASVGTGNPNLFTEADAARFAALHRLSSCGLGPTALQVALDDPDGLIRAIRELEAARGGRPQWPETGETADA